MVVIDDDEVVDSMNDLAIVEPPLASVLEKYSDDELDKEIGKKGSKLNRRVSFVVGNSPQIRQMLARIQTLEGENKNPHHSLH